MAQVAEQLEQLRPVRGGRVLEGLFRPELTVAICADGRCSSCRYGQERTRFGSAVRLEQVVGDPFGRAAGVPEMRRGPQMRVDEASWIELPTRGLAQQRVAKA